jgi:hypothetical protein
MKFTLLLLIAFIASPVLADNTCPCHVKHKPHHVKQVHKEPQVVINNYIIPPPVVYNWYYYQAPFKYAYYCYTAHRYYPAVIACSVPWSVVPIPPQPMLP